MNSRGASRKSRQSRNTVFRNRDDCFSIYSGYILCENCSVLNGHVLGYHDYKDKDRLHFQKKSIYQRKYHYKKKVNQVSRILELSDEQRCELIDKLMAIDNKIIEKLNNQFERKRMISIFYLVKNSWKKWEMKNTNFLI